MKKLIKIGIIVGLIIGLINIPWMTNKGLPFHFSIINALHMDYSEGQFLTPYFIKDNISRIF